MSNYHEPVEFLDEKTKEISRALNTLKEEIEAIEWYNQRISASKDSSLQSIMAHNRDEEIEHAVMTLEWLRRNMGGWDNELQKYLFTDDPITSIEEKTENDTNENISLSLDIGNLK